MALALALVVAEVAELELGACEDEFMWLGLMPLLLAKALEEAEIEEMKEEVESDDKDVMDVDVIAAEDEVKPDRQPGRNSGR